MKKTFRNRRGAASFYIVAFSTLILVVVSTGFATAILSEVTRTNNDDLSQSAYDSALAGVEDAKLAYASYVACKSNSASPECANIINQMGSPNCSMVGRMLGRISDDDKGDSEVMISDTVETSSGSVTTQTNQAYTCVKISTALPDYRASLSAETQQRIIQLDGKMYDSETGNPVKASDLKAIKLSWYRVRDDIKKTDLNYGLFDNGKVQFTPKKATFLAIAPPMLEVQLIQTAGSFYLSDFDIAVNKDTVALMGSDWARNGGVDDGLKATVNRGCYGTSACTDRATMYLVPIKKPSAEDDSYEQTQGGENTISVEQVAKTNDRFSKNKPFGVYCPEDAKSDFYCTTTIMLPQAVGGVRSDNTLLFSIYLPYGEPDTDFALSVLYEKGGALKEAMLRDAQILIDSTGRANDLFRRVETRLETADASFDYPMYAMELLGSGNDGNVVKKTDIVKREHNFCLSDVCD